MWFDFVHHVIFFIIKNISVWLTADAIILKTKLHLLCFSWNSAGENFITSRDSLSFQSFKYLLKWPSKILKNGLRGKKKCRRRTWTKMHFFLSKSTFSNSRACHPVILLPLCFKVLFSPLLQRSNHVINCLLDCRSFQL